MRKESGDFLKRPVRRLENDFGDQLILLSWESHDDLRHFFLHESVGVPGTLPFPERHLLELRSTRVDLEYLHTFVHS